MKISSTWLLTIADLFTNLSAGWFGAAFISPSFSNEQRWSIVLITNLLYGIVFLSFSVEIKKLVKIKR